MGNIQIKRIVALWIDMFVAGLIYGVIENFLPQVFEPIEKDLFGIQVRLQLSLAVLFYLLYFLVFDLLNQGVTVGKLVLKIKVVKGEDSRLTAAEHVVRTLLKMVSLIFLPIAALIFLFNKNYALHDRYTGTNTMGG